jgi:hypothetical protein
MYQPKVEAEKKNKLEEKIMGPFITKLATLLASSLSI